MYCLYEQNCLAEGSVPVKEAYYRDIFNTEFNLTFQKPLNDQCDVCTRFKHSCPSEKEKMEDDYRRHIRYKKMTRKHKHKW